LDTTAPCVHSPFTQSKSARNSGHFFGAPTILFFTADHGNTKRRVAGKSACRLLATCYNNACSSAVRLLRRHFEQRLSAAVSEAQHFS
jgi:hypothetical protein